ncbi:MAG: hypothetical protein ACK475_06575 [Bacteroidota bacterium]|jgi:hypothetical protein
MYKNVLTSIPGIEWYPIIALVLFFGFFSALMIWFVLVDTNRLQRLSSAVLDDGQPAGSAPSPTSSGE